MLNISPELLKALKTAETTVDGLTSLTVAQAVPGMQIKGKRQDCDYPDLGECEWVDQHQYGYDNFAGTISWRIGDHWLIAGFNT